MIVLFTLLTHNPVPSAPGGFHVVSSTSSSLSLAWSLPDPLNGPFAAYQLQYGVEETFNDDDRIRSDINTIIYNTLV